MGKSKRKQPRLATGTFVLINQAALSSLPHLLERWLPDGRLDGSEWVARNPRRMDHNLGSFKINVRTGQWADFATDDKGGDAISLLAYLEDVSQDEAARLLARELHVSTASGLGSGNTLPAREGVGGRIPSDHPATVQTLGCTLETYAQAKRLPVDFLQGLGLTEISYQSSPTVRIPYCNKGGQETAIRFRTSLAKSEGIDQRFRWKNGSKLCLYGLWRLRQESAVVIVEGESDCHTLWYYGINAVGLPGASTWNEKRDAPHLQSFEIIYVVIEPDQGGEATRRWIEQSALRDRIRLVRLGDSKDPSEMHLANPEQFKVLWQTALDAAVAWFDEARHQQITSRDEVWAVCKELACEPNILDRFVADVLRAGLVGVEREAKLLYLAVASRVLDRPLSIAVKGPSSAGKSYLVETVLSFCCSETYHALTAMSERALAYGSEPLRHRMLVLYEADGMSGETASYLIRSLLSEGCVRYQTVEKTPQGLTGRLIEREGPTGLIVTTTRDGLHPENETRLISLTVADNQEQTRAILDALAEEDRQDNVDRAPWIALQQWIGASDARVTIPFRRALMRLIPPIAVRLRRDGKLLLNLISTHALLQQASRARDDRGRVVATLQDYAAIYPLIADLMAEGVQATVPASIRETVTAISMIADSDGSATVSQVAAYLQLDVSSASRRCSTARKRGYLRNEEGSRGRPARYVVGDPLPAEEAILPTIDRLSAAMASAQASVCTFADDPTGYDLPPPPGALQGRRVVL